jgi:uncharacterized membrane protein
MTKETKKDPDQKSVLRLYAALGAAMALSLAPWMSAAFGSTFLFIGVLAAAYIMRGRNVPGSLMESHANYIIRTVWIASFITIFTLAAAGAYLLRKIDNTLLQPCIDRLLSLGGQEQLPPYRELAPVFEPCMEPWLRSNGNIFLVSVLLAGLPVFLYMLLRFSRGLIRTAGGYRIADARSWF